MFGRTYYRTTLLPAMLAALAFAPSTASAQTPLVAEDVHIAVVHEQVIINGARFSMPMQRKALIRVLGEPDREVKLANVLLTWDDLGLIAYQTPETSKITAFSIALDRQSMEFWPKKLFRGSLRVDAANITARSTIDEINRAKEGSLFERDNVLTDNFTFRHKRTSYYLEEADPKKTKDPEVKFTSLQICERLSNN